MKESPAIKFNEKSPFGASLCTQSKNIHKAHLKLFLASGWESAWLLQKTLF